MSCRGGCCCAWDCTGAPESVDVGGGRSQVVALSRPWRSYAIPGDPPHLAARRLEGRPGGSRSNNAQRWQCEGRACVAAAVMGVAVVECVCGRVCADRQQRVRVDVHSGAAAGAESSSSRKLAAAAEAGQRETQRQRDADRERAAAGALRFEWLNTLQSHPIPNPQPAHQPVREMSVKSGTLLQPLFWQVSHPALHTFCSIYMYLTRGDKRLCISPVIFTPTHVTRLPSLPL